MVNQLETGCEVQLIAPGINFYFQEHDTSTIVMSLRPTNITPKSSYRLWIRYTFRCKF